MKRKALGWTLLIVANVLVISVLCLHGPTTAAPQARPPFANPVEQRGAMVQELREIKALLREQNALLKDMADNEETDVKNSRK